MTQAGPSRFCFFSSRRRHTRCLSDWSSDVCSSDLSWNTTPQAAGGPNANLAGVFQLNSVSSRNGLTRVINDWEVGVPGFFGTNTRATLTAFLVSGTAPGVVTGHERPISNVIHETFTIGG